MSVDDVAFEVRLGRVESLLRGLEASSDVVAREGARELLQTVMELHARGLERLVSVCERSGALRELVEDPHIANLLALHGLHPIPLSERVTAALTLLENELAADGARAEIVSITEEKVSIRLHGSRSLERRLASALQEAAPDARDIHVETDPAPPAGLVQLRIRRTEVSR